jgi:hypothetical protein
MTQEDRLRIIKMLIYDYLSEATGNDYDKLHDALDIAMRKWDDD